jgi:hypothetical protein
MKLITNIQSFTDVITNSSSSVFIMHEDDANYYSDTVPDDCLTIQDITLDWVKEHYWEWELILQACNVDFSEVSHKEHYTYGLRKEYGYTYWKSPASEDWQQWVDANQSKLEPVLGKYFVEIEDHFEDAWDVTENAYGDAIASESRH